MDRSPAALARAEPYRLGAAGPVLSSAADKTLLPAAAVEQVRSTTERLAHPARSSTTPAESSGAAVAATGLVGSSTRPARMPPPGPAAAAVLVSPLPPEA